MEAALGRKDSVIGVVSVPELEDRVSGQLIGLGIEHTMAEEEEA